MGCRHGRYRKGDPLTDRVVSLDDSIADELTVVPEDADEWREQAIQILLDVAESMTRAQAEPAVLNRLADLALQATGADRCAILARDPNGGSRLLPAGGASRIDDDLDLQWRKFRKMPPIDTEGSPRELLWQIQQTVAVDDVASSPLIPDEWKWAWGSKSLAFTSLRAGGEVYGLLAVDYLTARHVFSPRECRLLDAIACGIGVALRSAGLVSRLQRALEVERRLAECIAALQSGRSLGEVLDLVVDRFAALVPAACHVISLFNDDQSSFRAVAYRGLDPPGAPIMVDALPADDVALVRHTWQRDPREPIIVANAGELPGWQEVVPSSIGPGMLVALWDGHAVLGFVAVGREADEAFDQDEIRLASAFAGQAALAVAQARLNDQLHARLRAVEVLQGLSNVVLRTSNLRSVLSSLNRGVGRELGVRCLSMSFTDRSLADLLNGRKPTPWELDLMRSWRGLKDPDPVGVNGDLAVPIPIRGRIAGLLLLRPRGDLDPALREFTKVLARGLGDVAYKAKLRRTIDERTRELAASAERERIARDLHDTVGQTFYGIGLKLQDLIAEIEDPGLAERFGQVRALTAQAVADVRSAVYALSFLHVGARGLIPSLRTLARQFAGACGVHADVRVEGQIPSLSEEVRSALYRVAHEAFVNVERHARATGVVVTLRSGGSGVELTIRDDGVGLDQRQAADWLSAAHFGMRSMAKAVEEVGGRFRVIPSSPRGLTIAAHIPLKSRRGSPSR